MAIKLTGMDIVVRRAAIEEKYPGLWRRCIDEWRDLIGDQVTDDGELLGISAQTKDDLKLIEGNLIRLGFEGIGEANPLFVWNDYCVIDRSDDKSIPCLWLRVKDGVAYKDERELVLTENGLVERSVDR